jgi:hypothetical protein
MRMLGSCALQPHTSTALNLHGLLHFTSVGRTAAALDAVQAGRWRVRLSPKPVTDLFPRDELV